ncbi:PepSY domain-containing protein [Robertmurraya sp.]|uniref:PepSY domain-containing protein n=1 Tax=Robertmurraya sp. TaxID=2837525 RepID=UPI003703F64C
MNLKKVVFLLLFLTVMFLTIEVQQILGDREDRMLTTSEIKSSIHSKYLGDIGNIKLNMNSEEYMYIVNLHSQNSKYNLKVDAYSGEILYLDKVASENLVTVGNQSISFVNGKASLDRNSLNCSNKISKIKKS